MVIIGLFLLLDISSAPKWDINFFLTALSMKSYNYSSVAPDLIISFIEISHESKRHTLRLPSAVTLSLLQEEQNFWDIDDMNPTLDPLIKYVLATAFGPSSSFEILYLEERIWRISSV